MIRATRHRQGAFSLQCMYHVTSTTDYHPTNLRCEGFHELLHVDCARCGTVDVVVGGALKTAVVGTTPKSCGVVLHTATAVAVCRRRQLFVSPCVSRRAMMLMVTDAFIYHKHITTGLEHASLKERSD